MSRLGAAALLMLTTVQSGPLAAQQVRGVVRDTAEAPLADVFVRAMRGGAGADTIEALSDSAGGFVLVLPMAGEWQLTAARLGYVMNGPMSLLLEAGEQVEVVIRMGTDPLALAPLQVVGRRRMPTMTQQVYARIERLRAQGVGRALTRAEIERMAPQSVGRAVAQLSGRIRAVESPSPVVNTILVRDASFRGNYCAPAVFIDGFRINNRPANPNIMIDPRHLEAIELYIGGAQAPIGFDDQRGCGSVLIWSRRGDPREGRPSSWKRWGIAAAVGVGLLLIVR